MIRDVNGMGISEPGAAVSLLHVAAASPAAGSGPGSNAGNQSGAAARGYRAARRRRLPLRPGAGKLPQRAPLSPTLLTDLAAG